MPEYIVFLSGIRPVTGDVIVEARDEEEAKEKAYALAGSVDWYCDVGTQDIAIQGIKCTSPIEAYAYTDDRVFDDITFDATPYFNAASDDSIIELARCEWGGDYAADEVAHFMAGQHSELKQMFKYIHLLADTNRQTGFECHVDKDSALAWIKSNRPGLYERLVSEGLAG